MLPVPPTSDVALVHAQGVRFSRSCWPRNWMLGRSCWASNWMLGQQLDALVRVERKLYHSFATSIMGRHPAHSPRHESTLANLCKLQGLYRRGPYASAPRREATETACAEPMSIIFSVSAMV